MRKKIQCPGCSAWHRSFPDRTVICQVCKTRFRISNDGETIRFSAPPIPIPGMNARFIVHRKKVSE